MGVEKAIRIEGNDFACSAAVVARLALCAADAPAGRWNAPTINTMIIAAKNIPFDFIECLSDHLPVCFLCNSSITRPNNVAGVSFAWELVFPFWIHYHAVGYFIRNLRFRICLLFIAFALQ
jgi:hypothetical protein